MKVKGRRGDGRSVALAFSKLSMALGQAFMDVTNVTKN